MNTTRQPNGQNSRTCGRVRIASHFSTTFLLFPTQTKSPASKYGKATRTSRSYAACPTRLRMTFRFAAGIKWWKVTGMTALRTGKFTPVTLGHMRSHGCRDLLIYCKSGHCNHSTTLNLGHLPDDTPINSLGYVIICEQCG